MTLQRKVELQCFEGCLRLNIVITKGESAALNWMLVLPLEPRLTDPKIGWWALTLTDHSPIAYDLNLHYHQPFSPGETPAEGCPYLKGACYTSTLLSKDILLPILRDHGLKGVFARMEAAMNDVLTQGDLL